MIKDTFFSFSRFGKLCRKEILENWKLYVLQLLVMYLIMAIILIWYSYTDYSSFNILTKTNDLNVHIFTLVFWMWSWWAFMCLGTSFAFKTMKCKTGRITMLMIPATVFEKFFFRWLVYVLIQSPNQKIPDRKTKCVIKTHINIKQNVIFGAKLKPV